MSSTVARSHIDHTGFYRGLLAFTTVTVPAFALVECLIERDISHDSLPVRLAFSGITLSTFLASFWSPTLRRHLRLASVLVCYALFAWFAYIGFLDNMALEDILGLLPLIVGLAVLIRRPWEIAVLLAFISAVLAIIYRFLDEPAVDSSVPFSLFVVFAGILGWMAVWRTRLEDALQVANSTLEARVAERTALLEREVAERVAAERLANAANEAKSRFLANMSHELRTPLNAVIGYTELVEQELALSDQAHHCEDLAKVGRAAGHLLTIIDNVLDLSRVESGSRALSSEPVAVRAAVDDAIILAQPAIDAQRDRLTVAVDGDLTVIGDREALVRVLVHLLDNAAKFTTRGTITLSAARVGEEVEIEVRDAGIGIPEAARPQIFGRFTQADDSSTRAHGGVGLGLAICNELVTRMQGTISVASVVGEGSTFTVRLPAA